MPNLSTDGVLHSVQHFLVMGKQQKFPLSFQQVENVLSEHVFNHNTALKWKQSYTEVCATWNKFYPHQLCSVKAVRGRTLAYITAYIHHHQKNLFTKQKKLRSSQKSHETTATNTQTYMTAFIFAFPVEWKYSSKADFLCLPCTHKQHNKRLTRLITYMLK